jgi:hypothetical protein
MMCREGIFMDSDSAERKTNQTSQTDLAEGYSQMVADAEHEKEAEEWAEGLIGDAFGVDQEPVQ